MDTPKRGDTAGAQMMRYILHEEQVLRYNAAAWNAAAENAREKEPREAARAVHQAIEEAHRRVAEIRKRIYAGRTM